MGARKTSIRGVKANDGSLRDVRRVRALRLREEGKTHIQIAVEMGIHPGYVGRLLRKNY